MKPMLTGLVWLLAAVALAAEEPQQAAVVAGERTGLLPVKSMFFDGFERSYRLYVPGGLDRAKPVPLVMALHGGGGNAEATVALTLGGFNALAEREKFLVVYPNGIEKNWNDGREGARISRAHEEKIDDVGFLCSLIDQLAESYGVDAKRVYATGISNGGHMSLRLACDKADRFAAVAAVAAALPEALAEAVPSGPVSVLIMNGTKDPLVPWDGGGVGILGGRGRDISTPDTAAFWAKHNGCPAEPSVRREPDSDPADGATVRRETWGPGKGGSEVVLYAIDGGGHTWPDGYQYLNEKLVGKTCRDINGCEVIWRFFKDHPRK